MKVIKIIGKILLFVLITAAIILVSAIGGWVLRYLVWLICFLIEILGNDWAIIDWISNNDTIMWIICSVVFWPIIILAAISGCGSSNTTTGNSNAYGDYSKPTHRSNSIEFVDAAGNWRRSGDDFIDYRGCWCKWGGEFVDGGGNWRKWGDDFIDGSGCWRRWGDDFVDGAGNWVRR